jgi:anaerobic selenocysteine-containing dehydrogenase
METVHRSCPICEASCGLRYEIDPESRRVLSVRGDDDDPRSRGYVCPKATAASAVFEDPDRLRRPLRRDRRSGSWQELGWESAYELVAERIRAVREAHGKDALALYIGNPIGHDVSGLLTVPIFQEAFGTGRLFSAATMDQMPKNVSSAYLYGDQWAIPIPDVDRTDYLLALGGNPLTSQGSLMSAPNAKKRFAELRARGGRLVVVDPRRTETAEIADRHLFIRPGSDALWLFALVNVLFAEERVALGRLAAFTDGVEAVRALAAPFTPEAVASATGIDPDVTRIVARELASAERAACYGRIGTCTQEFGTLASWLVDVVNALTGNLDRPGGALFPRPATGQGERHVWNGLAPQRDRWRSAARGFPEFEGQLPVACFAEELEPGSAGEERARALITLCGNPVLSSPNGARLGRALEQLDFMVSVDIYRNETTRHADVILPTTSQLERENYDFLFQGTSVRNFARWSPRLFEPEAGLPDLGQVLLELAGRANGTTAETLDELLFSGMLATFVGKPGTPAAGVDVERARQALGQERGWPRLLDLMLRTGPYGDGFDDAAEGLSLARLAAIPHALDLGPLESRLPGLLRNETGRLDLAPDYLTADVARLREALERTREDGALVLVGRRQLRNMNSWLHNLPPLAKGRERCTLLVSPKDAGRLGLADGAPARVRSRVGEVTAQVAVSDEMMPGVVSLPHGFGHTDPDVGLRVATSLQPGANSNQLCDEEALDPPSGTSVANGIPVEVLPA